MPKKLIVGDPARGLYKRGEKWWLYYRQGGKRIRVPLNTSDKREAIRTAGPLRGRPQESYAENPLVALGMQYVRAEEESSNFTASTARSTEYAIKGVARRMKLSRTSEIYKGTSQAVYDSYQDRTEATARTLSMRFHAFLQWLADQSRKRRLSKSAITDSQQIFGSIPRERSQRSQARPTT